MNSSSATTTSAKNSRWARICATSCIWTTASCWPCWASAPRPGKPLPATNSSAGILPPASATCRWSSITPAISSCPGFASRAWHRICSPASSANFPRTGSNATVCARFSWKRSAKPHASKAPASALRTGSISGRRRAAASSIPATSTTSPSRTSSSKPLCPDWKAILNR